MAKKNFVLDTSVYLTDADSIFKFDNHDIFIPLKEAILGKVWENINAKAHLNLNNGEIGVFQKDMPEKEIYEGNKVVTFQNLLEPEIANYLKKSDPEKAKGTDKTVLKTEEKNLSPKQVAWQSHRQKMLDSQR